MLTYLQIVNRVLQRMREATVATPTETMYSTLIANLVNQVKSEMERAWYWQALRDTYAVTAVDQTTSYAFTGAGPEAVVLDGWNTTTPLPLLRGTNTDFNDKFFNVQTVQTGPITQYLPAGVNADYDLKIDTWPKPVTGSGAGDALKFTLYVPQAELSDGGDIPLVPQSVLVEETVARAMIERGDEAAPKPDVPGDPFIMHNLLSAAISRDAGHADEDMDWVAE